VHRQRVEVVQAMPSPPRKQDAWYCTPRHSGTGIVSAEQSLGPDTKDDKAWTALRGTCHIGAKPEDQVLSNESSKPCSRSSDPLKISTMAAFSVSRPGHRFGSSQHTRPTLSVSLPAHRRVVSRAPVATEATPPRPAWPSRSSIGLKAQTAIEPVGSTVGNVRKSRLSPERSWQPMRQTQPQTIGGSISWGGFPSAFPPTPSSTKTTVAQLAAPGDDASILDDAAETQPWLAETAVAERRSRLGLDEPALATFMDGCEFISLGNFCGIARALQAIGLKKRSYPFDWVRAPLDGIIHCLETDFEDFLTFTTIRTDDAYGLKIFQGSRWGGSFWHHDPSAPKVRADMVRRMERFLGFAEVPASKPRIFVRCVNTTRELEAIPQLLQQLVTLFPEAHVRLLVIVDFQLSCGFVKLEEEGFTADRLLFYMVSEHVFSQLPWSMQRVAEMYAEAVAYAARFWASTAVQTPRIKAPAPPRVAADLAELRAIVDEFHGGSPASESFWPRRLQGQQITLKGTKRMPGLLVQQTQTQQPQQDVMHVRVPDGVPPGAFMATEAFGTKLKFPVPEGATGGQVLQLRLVEGVLSVALVFAAATTATAAAAATAAAGSVTARCRFGDTGTEQTQ